MPTDYDIFEDATSVVDNHLELLQALHEVKKLRMDARSRLICRCPTCRSEAEETLAWIGSIRQPNARQA
jgi:hypothetical protein